MREQSQPRKHEIRPAIYSGKSETMIEPGGDEDGSEVEGVLVLMAKFKLDREERGKKNGWVRREIEEAKTCMFCGDSIRWQGRCKKCIQSWVEGILPGVKPYMTDLGALYRQNQDRIVESTKTQT